MDDRLHVLVRPMRVEDIAQVLEVDRQSFPLAWSERTYLHEVRYNDRSTMIVLQKVGAQPIKQTNGSKGDTGWLKKLVSPTRNDGVAVPLLGYSGFWQIVDEAHISTIAVHPDWRGHRLGELLIWVMLRQAIEQNAKVMTLEVRVSNQVAINLYEKYGFEIVGRRKGYYRDNNEDAHIMGLEPLDAAYRARLARYGSDLARHIRVSARQLG